MGFNMLRKHIKVEPMRWYYHCDRLGMLVWQDMPSGGGKIPFFFHRDPAAGHRRSPRDNRYRAFARASSQGRAEYMDELEEMVLQLFNAPSVALWVPFNEGWGQFDSTLVMERLRRAGPHPARGPGQRLARSGRGRPAQPARVLQALPLPARPSRPRAGAERIWRLQPARGRPLLQSKGLRLPPPAGCRRAVAGFCPAL